jgi:hypothetical protein
MNQDFRQQDFPPCLTLPCGALAYNEQAICGYPSYRCSECMTIYGSIACPCNAPKDLEITKEIMKNDTL